ncbi:hypothetical protein [Stappia sp.]|uniref:hypothetical protein n=1 Tax=Stappia sp. TaxID=1870903 RepID=UPI0032D8FCF7
MTDAPIENTDRALEDDAFLPGGSDPGLTPFAELSRLMVVGIDVGNDNAVSYVCQDAPNGPWAGSWTAISDTAYLVLGTGVTTDGRVALAAQTRDTPTVHYIDEAPQGPGGGQRWNMAIDLGLPPGVDGLVQLVMGRDADGRISIFGVDGSTGNVWWIFENPDKIVDQTEEITPPGASEPITVHVKVAEPPDQPFGDWIQLPGAAISRLTLANNADGRIVLIGTGQEETARSVYVTQMKGGTTLTPGQWTDWTRIDTPASGPALSQPTAMVDLEGMLNIFMVCNHNQVAQIRQVQPGSAHWSRWVRPGMVDTDLVAVTAAVDGDGHILLMAIDQNKGLHANMQVDAVFQQWSSWRKIGIAPGFGEMGMDYNSDGRLTYFQGDGTDDSLHILSQFTLDSTSWDASFTTLTPAQTQIFTYGVVRDLTPPGTG